MAVGTIYTELDLDFSKFEKGQQKLLQSAQATSLSVEKNWKTLGAKSDVIYQAMANGAVNAYNMISNRAQTSAAEQFRAQSAMVAKINSINAQMTNNPLYETLGIKSVQAIEAQKAAVMASYETIKKSGTASSQDLINIEHAKNAKLKALNKEMVGDHDMSMAAMTRAVLRFYAAYYVISTGVQWVGKLFMGGVKAIDDLKVSTIAVAAQITTMQGTTGNIVENYKQNLIYAEALNKKLMEIDANSFANYQQIQLMNRAMVGQGVILDVNKGKQIESFTALTNAVAMFTTGQDKEKQASQEIRALMSGQIKAGDMVARMVDEAIKRQGLYKGGLKEVVRLGKEHGDTLERMQPYLIGIVAASGDIQTTWESVGSSIQTAWGILQRSLFKDFYKDLVEGGQKAAAWIKINADDIAAKINAVYDAISFAIKGTIVLVGAFAVATWTKMIIAGDATAWFALRWEAMTARVTLATSKMTLAWTGFAALIVGWEIGNLLNKFEFVRKAGVYMVYGIIDAWKEFVKDLKIDWEVIKGTAKTAKSLFTTDKISDTYKTTQARIEAIKKEYEAEKKLRAGWKQEQLKEVTDAAIATAKKKATPAHPTAPKIGGITEADEEALKIASARENMALDAMKAKHEEYLSARHMQLKQEYDDIKFTSEAQLDMLMKRWEDEENLAIDHYNFTLQEIAKEASIREKAEGAKFNSSAFWEAKLAKAREVYNKASIEAEIKANKGEQDIADATYKIIIEHWKDLAKIKADYYKGVSSVGDEIKKADDSVSQQETIYRDLFLKTGKYAEEYLSSRIYQIDAENDRLKDMHDSEGKRLIDDVTLTGIYAERMKEIYLEIDKAKLKSSEKFGDGWRVGLKEMEANLYTWGQAGYDFFKTFSENSVSTLSTMLFDGMKGKFNSFSDYWFAFTDTLLKKFSDIVARMVVDWALGLMQMKNLQAAWNWGTTLLGLLGSGAGSLATSSPSADYAGEGFEYHHNGGIIKAHQGAYIDSSIAQFIRSSQYAHDGLSLLPDERPIIAQIGEGILSRRGMANLGRDNFELLNSGKKSGIGGTNIINVSVPIEVPFKNKKFEANLRSKIEGNVPKLVRAAIREMA